MLIFYLHIDKKKLSEKEKHFIFNEGKKSITIVELDKKPH